MGISCTSHSLMVMILNTSFLKKWIPRIILIRFKLAGMLLVPRLLMCRDGCFLVGGMILHWSLTCLKLFNSIPFSHFP